MLPLKYFFQLQIKIGRSLFLVSAALRHLVGIFEHVSLKSQFLLSLIKIQMV